MQLLNLYFSLRNKDLEHNILRMNVCVLTNMEVIHMSFFVKGATNNRMCLYVIGNNAFLHPVGSIDIVFQQYAAPKKNTRYHLL
jgi:hypothetical protein